MHRPRLLEAQRGDGIGVEIDARDSLTHLHLDGASGTGVRDDEDLLALVGHLLAEHVDGNRILESDVLEVFALAARLGANAISIALDVLGELSDSEVLAARRDFLRLAVDGDKTTAREEGRCSACLRDRAQGSTQ